MFVYFDLLYMMGLFLAKVIALLAVESLLLSALNPNLRMTFWHV